MAVQTSFHGQLSMLNKNIEDLNTWLHEEVEVDHEFPTLHLLGTPTQDDVAEMVTDHYRKFKRFTRRIQRDTDIDPGTLLQHTQPIKFDLLRIRSMYATAD